MNDGQLIDFDTIHNDQLSDEPPSVCVVRLKTSIWKDKKGIHIDKKITYLRRKSSGYQILEEDADMIGADYVVKRIENLEECKDGIYGVRTNLTRDWESGTVEDYDYYLIPYHE